VLETVRAVLSSGGNLEASARAIFVHPNTVRYRLKRAAELTGQSVTDPRGSWTLQVALALAEYPQRTIVVEGYTDSTGTQSLNEELSQKRAEAVRLFLVEHGVDATRIRAHGWGPARPVADNKTPEGRANNRRVEIVIEKGQ